MKAAVYWGAGDLRVEEVPIPEVGPGEMLVRVEACGICGTDIKKIEKGLLPGPRIFGHEICGHRGAGARRRAGSAKATASSSTITSPAGAASTAERKAYAQCEVYKRNGTTAGFEPAGGGFAEYVKAMRLDRRARGNRRSRRRPPRRGGLRRAREHLPEGGAEGGRRRRARPCWWWGRGRSASC